MTMLVHECVCVYFLCYCENYFASRRQEFEIWGVCSSCLRCVCMFTCVFYGPLAFSPQACTVLFTFNTCTISCKIKIKYMGLKKTHTHSRLIIISVHFRTCNNASRWPTYSTTISLSKRPCWAILAHTAAGSSSEALSNKCLHEGSGFCQALFFYRILRFEAFSCWNCKGSFTGNRVQITQTLFGRHKITDISKSTHKRIDYN